jgi:hypothetical protein
MIYSHWITAFQNDRSFHDDEWLNRFQFAALCFPESSFKWRRRQSFHSSLLPGSRVARKSVRGNCHAFSFAAT